VKLIVTQLAEIFPNFYDTQSFDLVFARLYPEPAEFSPQPYVLFLRYVLILCCVSLGMLCVLPTCSVLFNHQSLSSLLCNYFYQPVTFLLHPNHLLSTF
jgi:hypothetical protein